MDKPVAMEEGVLYKEKVTWDYPPGRVPLSDSNELWASNEHRKTVQDFDVKYPDSSSRRDVTSPDGPGTEAWGNEAHHPNATEGRRIRAQERTFPGAFREGGLSNEEGYEEDERTIESHTEPEPIPPTLSAELVNTVEEERRVQAQIDQALQRQLQKAAVAEVVLNRGRRRWVILLLLILTVLGVVLGITLRPDAAVSIPVPTPVPTLSLGDLSYLLGSVSSDNGEALQSSSTPQNMAFKWLANDTLLGTYTNETIIQRYALATLYYSTNGDSWVNNASWLDDGDECDSFQVECTDGVVASLNLSSNNLFGMIPPEIGLLSDSLSKFIIKESHNE
jgi:histone H3/H4